MNNQLLVLNAGSSSLKFALFQADETALPVRWRGQISSLSRAPKLVVRDAAGNVSVEHQLAASEQISQAAALDWVLDWLTDSGAAASLCAVGHRVVHGGMRHCGAARVDASLQAELQALVALAPLHQPHNLAAISSVSERYPELPQMACFDTAFHRSNSDLVQRYALPEAWHQAGVRRYGFHGLSFDYIAGVLADHDASAANGKTIVLHLGAGASLCAMNGGVSVASSMGFSALDGVPMATRCGALDPGVILYLMQQQGLSAEQVQDLLYQQSGLLGVSGISGDLRQLDRAGTESARLAIELMAYRIVREIGSLVAALGGLDALVFTAGIGEHSAAVRAMICAQLTWLGVDLDVSANNSHQTRISHAHSRVAALVIATDEEQVIAQQTCRLLNGTNRHACSMPTA